jgi:hypothetical protein
MISMSSMVARSPLPVRAPRLAWLLPTKPVWFSAAERHVRTNVSALQLSFPCRVRGVKRHARHFAHGTKLAGRDFAQCGEAPLLQEAPMALILTFVALALIGQAANLAISIGVENAISTAASVPVFFVLMLATFWLSWRLALWFTQPAADATRSRRQPRHEAHA